MHVSFINKIVRNLIVHGLNLFHVHLPCMIEKLAQKYLSLTLSYERLTCLRMVKSVDQKTSWLQTVHALSTCTVHALSACTLHEPIFNFITCAAVVRDGEPGQVCAAAHEALPTRSAGPGACIVFVPHLPLTSPCITSSLPTRFAGLVGACTVFLPDFPLVRA